MPDGAYFNLPRAARPGWGGLHLAQLQFYVPTIRRALDAMLEQQSRIPVNVWAKVQPAW